MTDPKIKSAGAMIKYTSDDGYHAEVSYSSRNAPKDRPHVALLGAFEELSRLLHLFGFGEQAMKTARDAGERVRVSRSLPASTPLTDDDAAAQMYPSDLERFKFGEHTATAFSIKVGCPEEVSVPLFTLEQVRNEIERLRSIVDEVHSWAVCACIASPEDMAQNFPRIVEITGPQP